MVEIADAHSDFAGFWANGGYGGRLYDSGGVEDMLRGGVRLQVFAAWVPPGYGAGLALCEKQFCFMRKIIGGSDGKIILCTKADDLNKKDALKAVFAVESGETIGFDAGAISGLYGAGVRMMSLTWNGENEFASGCHARGGLKEKGALAVGELDRLNIALDMSHINEQGFWEAAQIYRRSPCASHSCAFRVKEDPRNLKDDQIKHLIGSGGYIGVNFYTEFLKGKNAAVEDVLEHIEHILSLGGEDCAGFGSDFFGIRYAPEGLGSPSDFQRLPEAMAKRNYPQELISKICYGNLERYILKFLQ